MYAVSTYCEPQHCARPASTDTGTRTTTLMSLILPTATSPTTRIPMTPHLCLPMASRASPPLQTPLIRVKFACCNHVPVGSGYAQLNVPPGCTTTPPQHTWPSVIFRRRSYRLEFASRRAPSPRSRLCRRHSQTVAEDIFLAQH